MPNPRLQPLDNHANQKTAAAAVADDAPTTTTAPPAQQPTSTPWSPEDADVPPEERRLRLFDLDKRYGPCIGMTRTERWRRAQELGLDPPAEVRELLASSGGVASEACLWTGRV